MAQVLLQRRDLEARGQVGFEFEKIVERICNLPWEHLSEDDVLRVAFVYYYFSVQFRENLEIATQLYPADEQLKKLWSEECQTSNLSPWDGIARENEKMNHDEFVRRVLALEPARDAADLELAGRRYLDFVRRIDKRARAKSIASFEDGGLFKVFCAMLRARSWSGPGARAFRHFLEKHLEFDGAGDSSHGALSRHLSADDSILPLWGAFEDILLSAIPAFARRQAESPAR